MRYYRVTHKVLTLEAAGGVDTGRVWEAPCGAPFRDITVYLSSRGIATAAGNLTWEVFYGGVWAGVPFADGVTHSGGVSYGTAAIAGGTELANMVYEDASLLPPNLRSMRGGIDLGIDGFPIVLELTNAKAAPVTVYVTFVSRTVPEL